MATKPYKRRFGDRPDGRKVRTLYPMSRLTGFFMPDRSGACNQIRDSFPLDEVEKYIHKKRREGLKNFGILHMFLAAYIRTVSQRPALNRFFSGQTVFARHDIEIAMTIKKEMTLEAPDSCIKVVFEPDCTAEDVYNRFNEAIEEYKKSEADEESSFDSIVRIFNYIPRLVLKFVVHLLKTMDYFGLLPKFLLKVSPFHASLFITSMGSLGIPPIYHHLYNFGNVPVFISYGAKRAVNEVQKDGTVTRRKYMDFTVVCDERICDGYYFASALRMMRSIMDDPAQLDQKPETVIDDIP